MQNNPIEMRFREAENANPYLRNIVQHEESVSTCIYTLFCLPCSYGQMTSFAEQTFTS